MELEPKALSGPKQLGWRTESYPQAEAARTMSTQTEMSCCLHGNDTKALGEGTHGISPCVALPHWKYWTWKVHLQVGSSLGAFDASEDPVYGLDSNATHRMLPSCGAKSSLGVGFAFVT